MAVGALIRRRLPAWPLLLLAGCVPWASEEELAEVAGQVRQLEVRTVSDVTSLRARTGLTDLELREVAEVQQAHGESLTAMGEGFNTLSQAVDEAHRNAETVGRRQRALERTFDRRTGPALPPPPRLQRWLGTGQDRRSGEPLEELEIEALPNEPGRLRVWPPEADAPSAWFELETLGRRLLAPDPDPDVARCLDILWQADDSDDFVAADCSDPFRIWAFGTDSG